MLEEHIEGTFEPALMLKIARRNGLLEDKAWCERFSYTGNDEAWCREQTKLRENFGNLQEFLDLYYAGCNGPFFGSRGCGLGLEDGQGYGGRVTRARATHGCAER